MSRVLDIIAGDVSDFIPLQPFALGPAPDGVHAALDIHPPGVGNQPDIPLLGRAGAYGLFAYIHDGIKKTAEHFMDVAGSTGRA